MTLIYKICSQQDWDHAHLHGFFNGAAIDLKDGYIHFSTKETLRETYNKYFKDQSNLIIFEIESDHLPQEFLKWEIARNNKSFPHLYCPLDMKHVRWHQPAHKALTSLCI